MKRILSTVAAAVLATSAYSAETTTIFAPFSGVSEADSRLRIFETRNGVSWIILMREFNFVFVNDKFMLVGKFVSQPVTNESPVTVAINSADCQSGGDAIVRFDGQRIDNIISWKRATSATVLIDAIGSTMCTAMELYMKSRGNENKPQPQNNPLNSKGVTL